MTISQAASVNLWREAILDRLAVLCMDAPQDEPPASILRRIIAAEVEIALDPRVSDAVPHRTLLQQALDALSAEHHFGDYDALCTALRKALEAPEPGPVAWYLPSPDGDDSIFRDHRTVVACTGNKWDGFLPLYAAPPAAPAPAAPVVPLTDEQIRTMWMSSEFRGNGGQVDWFCEGIRAAEAHHGITGASK